MGSRLKRDAATRNALDPARRLSRLGFVTEETPDSLIPYDEIVQEALRAVVGRVLQPIEHNGELPGNHHFYITFKTQAPGVNIPKHLIARFPDEMTIVLQNKFWDLKVHDDSFAVRPACSGHHATPFMPSAAI